MCNTSVRLTHYVSYSYTLDTADSAYHQGEGGSDAEESGGHPQLAHCYPFNDDVNGSPQENHQVLDSQTSCSGTCNTRHAYEYFTTKSGGSHIVIMVCGSFRHSAA